jgi:replication factor A1
MRRTKTELYEQISDLKAKKDFDKEIKKRYTQYGELVDKDTIAFLLVDELGRNTQSTTPIADLRPDSDFTVVGRVLSVSDSRTFRRKNGSAGKVLNLEIADDTGTCKCVLWNGDIDKVKNKDIRVGTTIKIVNGYTKQGYSGDLEINLGRWGTLKVEPGGPLLLNDSNKNDTDRLTGVLVHKESSRAFFKDDGEFGFVTTITVRENSKETQIILWDRCVKDIQKCMIGDTITLTKVTVKQNDGKVEYHMNGDSTILKHS